jgi:RNA polymerase sigma-70 factor (ECF subfamily)
VLCDRYGPRVVRLVRRLFKHFPRSKLDTDDLVQSSLREIFRDLTRFEYRGERAFIAWLGSIVENKIRSVARYWASHARTAEREDAIDVAILPKDGPTPSQEVRRQEEQDLLYRAIDRLPPRQRRIVIKRMILGLPWEAIAREGDVSVHAAQMQLTRAKRRLARELKRLNPDA